MEKISLFELDKYIKDSQFTTYILSSDNLLINTSMTFDLIFDNIIISLYPEMIIFKTKMSRICFDNIVSIGIDKTSSVLGTIIQIEIPACLAYGCELDNLLISIISR